MKKDGSCPRWWQWWWSCDGWGIGPVHRTDIQSLFCLDTCGTWVPRCLNEATSIGDTNYNEWKVHDPVKNSILSLTSVCLRFFFLVVSALRSTCSPRHGHARWQTCLFLTNRCNAEWKGQVRRQRSLGKTNIMDKTSLRMHAFAKRGFWMSGCIRAPSSGSILHVAFGYHERTVNLYQFDASVRLDAHTRIGIE